jgi:hypothetical protein
MHLGTKSLYRRSRLFFQILLASKGSCRGKKTKADYKHAVQGHAFSFLTSANISIQPVSAIAFHVFRGFRG